MSFLLLILTVYIFRCLLGLELPLFIYFMLVIYNILDISLHRHLYLASHAHENVILSYAQLTFTKCNTKAWRSMEQIWKIGLHFLQVAIENQCFPLLLLALTKYSVTFLPDLYKNAVFCDMDALIPPCLHCPLSEIHKFLKVKSSTQW